MIVSTSVTLDHAVAGDEVVFAVGDVHGLSDALHAGLRSIARTPTPPGLKRHLVFLNDIIDHGKDSLGCIDLAIASAEIARVHQVTGLMANHEMLLAIALRGTHGQAQAPLTEMWVRHGGRQFLAELGLEPGATRRQLNQALGPKRVEWVTSLRPFYRSGAVAFVHAGLDLHDLLDCPSAFAWDIPASALDMDRHPSWIEDPFLERRGPDCHGGLFVCHGHAFADMLRQNGIGRARQVAGPPELSDIAITARERLRINLDAGAPSKKAVRIAQFQGQRVTVSHISV